MSNRTLVGVRGVAAAIVLAFGPVSAPTGLAGTDILPPAPTGLRAAPGDGSVRLVWDRDPRTGIVGYNLHRSPNADGPFTQVNPQNSLILDPVYLDRGLAPRPLFYRLTGVDAEGDESQPGDTVQADVGTVVVDLVEIRSRSGEAVRIPISTLNARGVGGPGLRIDLRYPPTFLNFSRVESTALTRALNFTFTDDSANGSVVIQGQPATAPAPVLNGEGRLFDVIFGLAATPGGSQAGGVFFGPGSELFDPQGERIDASFADQGSFQVVDNSQQGDLDGDGSVTPQDVQHAGTIALGLAPADPDVRAVGDFNLDGIVDLADMVLLSRLARGLSTNPSAFTPNVGKGVPTFTLTAKDASFVVRGEETVVSLGMQFPADGENQIAGLAFKLNYDSDLVDLMEVRTTTLSQGFDLIDLNEVLPRFDEPGVLRGILSAAQNRPAVAGDWVEVVFQDKLIAPDDSTSPVKLFEVKFADQFGEDKSWNAEVETVDGVLTFGPPPPCAGAPPPCLLDLLTAVRQGVTPGRDLFSFSLEWYQ